MQLPRVFISMSHAVIDTGSWAFGEHSALLATNAQQVGDSEILNTLYLPGFAACQRPARCSVLLVITLFDSSEQARSLRYRFYLQSRCTARLRRAKTFARVQAVPRSELADNGALLSSNALACMHSTHAHSCHYLLETFRI